MTIWQRYALPATLIVAGLLLIGYYWIGRSPTATPSSPPTPTSTPEPILPTRTPAPIAESQPATATPPATPTTDPNHLSPADRARFGVSGYIEDVPIALNAGLPFQAYLGWGHDHEAPPGIDVWQMIRLAQDGIRLTTYDYLDTVIAARPGSVWIIGNEPDVMWQDNVTPEQYARLYHELYTYIKERDPSAQIAPAGIAQPTPLRLDYLDIVLDSYQTAFGEQMPVDIWTLHAFILREEQDSWGVGIPPGMAERADNGRLYEISDHNDIATFRQFLRDFRQWMKANGYQDVPLAITEFGILMPADYGFPPEVVADWMRQTFTALLTETDAEMGYPADNGRLVQYWFWYMLRDDPDYYPTGNLLHYETDDLTLLGETYRDYINSQ